MNLYVLSSDGDTPIYIVALSYEDALKVWRKNTYYTNDPETIALVCDEHNVLISDI